MKRQNVVGVDGCRGGWFAVAITADGQMKGQMFASLDALGADWPATELMLIDMPIGLPDVCPRGCDRAARRLLGRRFASCIFPTPSRTALDALSYSEACLLNAAALNVKLSKQTWNILPKIRELDLWLWQAPITMVRECHPELAFWALNGGSPLRHGKKTLHGRQERLALLKPHVAAVDTFVGKALSDHRRSVVSGDDVLDAVVLAVTAWISGGRLASVPEVAETDACGLVMEIVFAPVSAPALTFPA